MNKPRRVASSALSCAECASPVKLESAVEGDGDDVSVRRANEGPALHVSTCARPMGGRGGDVRVRGQRPNPKVAHGRGAGGTGV